MLQSEKRKGFRDCRTGTRRVLRTTGAAAMAPANRTEGTQVFANVFSTSTLVASRPPGTRAAPPVSGGAALVLAETRPRKTTPTTRQAPGATVTTKPQAATTATTARPAASASPLTVGSPAPTTPVTAEVAPPVTTATTAAPGTDGDVELAAQASKQEDGGAGSGGAVLLLGAVVVLGAVGAAVGLRRPRAGRTHQIK